MNGTLYVCSTPIGNMEDITLRALKILRDVDRIVAEDTRHTRKLLAYHGISKPLISCHRHNEATRSQEILTWLTQNMSVALVSDAGTPGISDPGATLVARARAAGLEVVPVPGVSSVTAALSVAGFAGTGFTFHGFLPRTAGKRREAIHSLLLRPETQVVYEAPHRLKAFLTELARQAPDRRVVVAREMTKVHEDVFVGTAGESAARYYEGEVRGEVTVVVAGGERPESVKEQPADGLWVEEVGSLEAGGMSRKDAIKAVAQGQGIPRREVYNAVMRAFKQEAR